MQSSPSATDILNDVRVLDALRSAFEESDVGGAHPTEQGGFILFDPATGEFQVRRLPAQSRDSLAYPIRADGMLEGKQIVGSFHTHPNVGPEWQQEPSPQDIRMSQEYPETMGPHQFVLSHDTVYHIDNAGMVSEIGSTDQLLGLDRDMPQ